MYLLILCLDLAQCDHFEMYKNIELSCVTGTNIVLQASALKTVANSSQRSNLWLPEAEGRERIG